jgi:hydrogenase-4 component E
MTAGAALDMVEMAAGVVLAAAVLALWRKDLRALTSVLALQGVALAALAAVLALDDGDVGLGVVAALVLVTKGLVIPGLLARVVRADPGSRETAPLVNVPASLVTAAVLVVLSYLVAGRLTALFSDPLTRLAPLGLATVLVGFFVLVTRRKAVSQIVGLLLVDNGVALVAFLLTAGVPLLVELGTSLDVLLVVVVLQVLATTMRARYGHLDLDQLRELHD